MARNTARKSGAAAKTRLEDARERMYRELILESAEAVFGEKGFAGATMQDIAGRAGISLKTLYAAFASKRALIDEVQITRGQEFVEACNEAMAGGTGPMDAIARGIRAYVAYLFEYRDWLKLHLRARASWTLRPRGKKAQAMWRSGHVAYQDMIRQAMEEGLLPEGDPEELAALTQAVMQVAVARAADANDWDVDAVASRIVAHVRRLVGAPPEEDGV